MLRRRGPLWPSVVAVKSVSASAHVRLTSHDALKDLDLLDLPDLHLENPLQVVVRTGPCTHPRSLGNYTFSTHTYLNTAIFLNFDLSFGTSWEETWFGLFRVLTSLWLWNIALRGNISRITTPNDPRPNPQTWRC